MTNKETELGQATTMKKATLAKISNAPLPAKMFAALCMLICVGAATPPETHPSAAPVKMEPEPGMKSGSGRTPPSPSRPEDTFRSLQERESGVCVAAAAEAAKVLSNANCTGTISLVYSPPAPRPPTPPASPPMLCENTCTNSFGIDGTQLIDNDHCQDGHEEADGAVCDLGTDCNDCGPREFLPPPSPPPPSPLSPSPSSPPTPPPMLCSDTCSKHVAGPGGAYAKNDYCQDGGNGATGSSCAYGTDCTDCGPRFMLPPMPPSPPPPSPSPPPSSPSPPACTSTFTSNADLKTAATEYDSNVGAATTKYGAIAGWCVSGVTDMSFVFSHLHNFNADISGWDTSRVTSMHLIFWQATAFNQPLSSWDTSRVTDMSSMFRHAEAFNQPLSWDTSRVKNMFSMLYAARAFNQSLSWDVSSVTDMGIMFLGASSLSTANKLRIRCAWAGTPAFASAGYGSSWAPGSCP